MSTTEQYPWDDYPSDNYYPQGYGPPEGTAAPLMPLVGNLDPWNWSEDEEEEELLDKVQVFMGNGSMIVVEATRDIARVEIFVGDTQIMVELKED